MAYIYKIENQINGKIYIGKTLKTPEERWKEHIRDSKKETESHRPLYRAFHKYGIENFIISIIEECSHLVLNDREKYWIEIFGSFKDGYNATKGGDGAAYADYDLIYTLFNEGKTIKEISMITKYDIATCRIALDNYGVTKEQRSNRRIEKISNSVLQINKETNEIIAVYPSITAAYNALGKQHSGHIASVCNGKRKTAYGYKWKYSSNL